MRRTLPAVSFAPSHVQLMMRSSKPILATDMDSYARMNAAWNDLPFCFAGKAKYEWLQWDDRARFEFGIRRVPYHTKINWIMMNTMYFIGLLLFLEIAYILPWMIIVGKGPEHLSRDNGIAYSKKMFGVDVWCADGKFIRPFFHMVPPMFTMTVDEL